MPRNLKHNYSFDPSYGFSLDALLQVEAGKVPKNFVAFWQQKHEHALNIEPYVSIQDTGRVENNWRVFDCYYNSTDGMRIGGWLLLPVAQEVTGALICSHGYGGIEAPDTSWNLNHTAILFPCSRGIGRSAKEPFSSKPEWHVLHDIQDKHQYVIGGCVEDIWCGISALTHLFPQVKGHIGFSGSSFGGGLGVFACAFDNRISRCHFHVPTFGNLKVRLGLDTVGSTASIIDFQSRHPQLIEQTLPYFDASCAATFITIPSYWALAMFDPFVAPPGQFSIYNACRANKRLYKLRAGHHVYVGEGKQRKELRKDLEEYFLLLGAGNAS